MHGWIYGLADGLVQDLGLEADAPDKLDADYANALAGIVRATPHRPPTALPFT